MKTIITILLLATTQAFAVSSWGEGSSARGDIHFATIKAEDSAIRNTQTKCIQMGGTIGPVSIVGRTKCLRMPGTRGIGQTCTAFASGICTTGQVMSAIGTGASQNLRNRPLRQACATAFDRAHLRAQRQCTSINSIKWRVHNTDRATEIAKCQRRCKRSRGVWSCEAKVNLFCITDI